MSLSGDEKELLSLLQTDLPLTTRPFKRLAEKLGWTEEEVLTGLQKLADQGILKRIAPLLHHRQAGFKANGMVVWQIAREKEDEVGQRLAGFSEVSHCYLRPTTEEWPYNIFTMVHAETEEELSEIVEKMAASIDYQDYQIISSTEEFKKSSLQYFS